MSDLAARIAAYLAHRQPHAADVAVDDLHRIHGGSSQETFRFRARWREVEREVERRLILRREPVGGLVVAERDLEYNVYRALAGRGVPTPAAHFLELDPAWLDRPFFIMDLAPGRPGQFNLPDEDHDGHDSEVAGSFWRILGTLAALDHRALGLTALRNGDRADGYWARELDHWEAILDAGERIADPIARGAIRWMRANPPPEPARPAIIHGDYRSGNFLFTPDGTITAVLDWEMAHVGDPLEDIAWAINQVWTMTRHLPLEDGLGLWEAASGLTIDRAALDWWRLFTAIKAGAIWVTAEASFIAGKSRELVVALAPLSVGHIHRREVLTHMAERGAMG